eukprot:365521-Chlamydomonas_euryale.AAC.4
MSCPVSSSRAYHCVTRSMLPPPHCLPLDGMRCAVPSHGMRCAVPSHGMRCKHTMIVQTKRMHT